MKKNFSRLILLLALLAALWALSSCSQTVHPAWSAAAFGAQVVTPPPPVEDHSEIGSTSGILVMGIAIAIIAIAPVWMYGRRK